jgi:hypothetical protein
MGFEFRSARKMPIESSADLPLANSLFDDRQRAVRRTTVISAPGIARSYWVRLSFPQNRRENRHYACRRMQLYTSFTS